jgi:hypothetical protein
MEWLIGFAIVLAPSIIASMRGNPAMGTIIALNFGAIVLVVLQLNWMDDPNHHPGMEGILAALAYGGAWFTSFFWALKPITA